jgi:hypothetical protein
MKKVFICQESKVKARKDRQLLKLFHIIKEAKKLDLKETVHQ